MNLLYGEDKFFIGAVKFFDLIKDFGFIASNNCNMPTAQYNQDFYVNSASFVEEEAKEDGRIVVFQVEKQKSGRTRAVNVRRITKSEDDINLALSYYGEHEYIAYKEGIKTNLFNRLPISRNRVVTNGKGYFYRRESSTNGTNKGQEAIIRVSGEISPALSQQPPQSRVCIRGNSTKVGLRGEENR